MFDLHADLRTTAGELARIADLLERLVLAAERLSPAILPDDRPVYQATLEDLKVADPEEQEQRQAARAGFAERHGVVPDTPAFELALQQWKDDYERVHGKAAAEAIDWDRALTEARSRF